MKSTLMLLAGGLALLGAAAQVQASSSLDLNLGPDAVQFAAAGEVVDGISLGGGVLHSEYREDATVFHAQLMGASHTREREVGVGARWTQYDTDIGKGGGLGLGGSGFYPPGVVASRDLEDGYEIGVRARYAFTPNVDGYLGLRQLGADFDNDASTRTLDRGAQAGVRLRF